MVARHADRLRSVLDSAALWTTALMRLHHDQAPLSSWFPARRPLILGHRGASSVAPENTIGAFMRAMQDGADGIELDTCLSQDLVPVVLHDDTLDRTTNAVGDVSTWPVADLAKVNANKLKPEWGFESVPSLSEVLSALPDAAVCNVEIKGPQKHATLVPHTIDVIRPHLQRLRIIISSFYPDILWRVRKVAPDIPIGLLVEDGLDEQERPLWQRALLTVPILRPEALHLPASMIDAAMLQHARRAHVRLNIWAVNTTAEAIRLNDLGVDGLIIDDVAQMRGLFVDV